MTFVSNFQIDKIISVLVFDFCLASNSGNGRALFDLSIYRSGDKDSVPFGLEVDTAGMLYVPNYVDGTILKLDPR